MKNLGRIGFLLVALSLGTTGWGQAVFNKFGPAAGIQKNTGATYQNTAAAASDITPLFGCGGSSTLFLRGDGSCAAPAGTGVSSVSVPVPLTASSCSGGACSITWTTGQTANRVLATPDGTTGAVSLRALVAGDVPPIALGSTANGGVASASILLGTNGGTSNGFFSVTGPTTTLRTFTFPNASATVLTTNAAVTVPQGGTGLATLTAHGVLLGEGTSNLGNVAAMAADTLLQGQGVTADPAAVAINNCGSATTALSYSTSTHTFGCQTITAGGTGTVTSITGGTGITASPNPIVSTGTLTVDQAFSPTWTGGHTFSQAQGSTRFTLSGPNTGVGWNAVFTDTTNSVSRGFIGIGTNTVGGAAVTDFAISPGASGSVVIGTANGGAIGTRFGPNGNVSINAPSSGATTTFNGIASSAQSIINLIGGTNGSAALLLQDGQTGTRQWLVEAGNPAVGNFRIRDATAGADRFVINTVGNVTINAPTSGATLALNFVSGTNGLTIADGTVAAVMGTGGGQLNVGTTNATAMAFATNGSTRVTVGSTGGVTVGSPTGGSQGAGTINMTGCFVNGSPCLTGSTTATRFAAGVLTVTGSGSCLAQNTANISTCTSGGTGLAHVTFTTAFSSATCVAGSVDVSPVLIATNPGTSVTSTADFDLRNTSSALTNGSLSITCIGN